MTLKFAKRVAAQLLNRGESSIRFREDAIPEIAKAITREDIKKLIGNGSILALKAKHNISMNAKIMRKKRAEGRRRGVGRRKGTKGARRGVISWEKKVRSQRMLLSELKRIKKLDSKQFMKFYMLVKGNSFANKASLLLHMKDEGISISDEEIRGINEKIKGYYK